MFSLALLSAAAAGDDVYMPPAANCAALLSNTSNCAALARHRGLGLPAGLPSAAADQKPACGSWAALGECSRNPEYMENTCCVACLRQRCMRAVGRPASAPHRLDATGSQAKWQLLLDHTARRQLAAFPYDAAGDECDTLPVRVADDASVHAREAQTYGEVCNHDL